jgi:hypothetical protein
LQEEVEAAAQEHKEPSRKVQHRQEEALRLREAMEEMAEEEAEPESYH